MAGVPNWVWFFIGVCAILGALYLVGIRFNLDVS